MAKAKLHKKVKLIFGLISSDDKLFDSTEKILSKEFGQIDFSSNLMAFDYTDYYYEEMGNSLKRKFISFRKPINPQELSRIKKASNKLEEKFLAKGKRQINIDPGYITEAKLILASAKDFTHRIYLKDGIFAEVTLYYQDKSFQGWQWTFPDYKTKSYIGIFNQIRDIYARQLKYEKVA